MADQGRRLTPDEFTGVAMDLARCRSDEDLLEWVRENGENLIETVRKEMRDHKRAMDAVRCLGQATIAATAFFRATAEQASQLSVNGPVRKRIFEAAKSHGPVLLGQLAAAQACAQSDDLEERMRIARENVTQLLGGAGKGMFEISDENLSVPGGMVN